MADLCIFVIGLYQAFVYTMRPLNHYIMHVVGGPANWPASLRDFWQSLKSKKRGFERQFTACEARKNIRGQGPCAQITVGISIHHTLDKKLPFAGGLISVAI